MELEDLKKSIAELSDEELQALLSGSRQNRRVSKRPPSPVKKQAAPKVQTEASTDALMNAMNKDQIEKLLAMMGEKK